METWTITHIHSLAKLTTLEHSISSVKLINPNIKHRISITYTKDIKRYVMRFMFRTSAITYNGGITELTQHQHLKRILFWVNREQINPTTMICFLEDSDLMLSYPDYEGYDVVVGRQLMFLNETSTYAERFSRECGESDSKEHILGLQSRIPVENIKSMMGWGLVLTYPGIGFSGYSARLGIVRKVLDDVRRGKEHKPGLKVMNLSIMSELYECEVKLDSGEPFIYHRLFEGGD